jgi:hypothetical protein
LCPLLKPKANEVSRWISSIRQITI